MQQIGTLTTRPGFGPVSRNLALEPRLLYDGAAAVAAEHQQNAFEAVHDDMTEAHKAAAADGKHLLVIDGRLAGAQALTDDATPGTTVRVVDPFEDGVAAVGQALAALEQVESVQILSHGAPGQLTLGNSLLTAGSADTSRTAGWAPHLSHGADLLIYGCATADSDSGRALLDALAQLTGADVAASSNNTGSTEAGGDWTLEVATGKIDSALRIAPEALAQFDDLLGRPFAVAPSLTLVDNEAVIPVGGTETIHVMLTTPSNLADHAPFIEILLPATGHRGNDGVHFVSGRTGEMGLPSEVVRFGANGSASHPLASEGDGTSVTLHASDYGYRPGDQLAVVAFPRASLRPAQSTIWVGITLHMSRRAESCRTHAVLLRAGVLYGPDPLNRPALFEANWQAYTLRSSGPTANQTGASSPANGEGTWVVDQPRTNWADPSNALSRHIGGRPGRANPVEIPIIPRNRSFARAAPAVVLQEELRVIEHRRLRNELLQRTDAARLPSSTAPLDGDSTQFGGG